MRTRVRLGKKIEGLRNHLFSGPSSLARRLRLAGRTKKDGAKVKTPSQVPSKPEFAQNAQDAETTKAGGLAQSAQKIQSDYLVV